MQLYVWETETKCAQIVLTKTYSELVQRKLMIITPSVLLLAKMRPRYCSIPCSSPVPWSLISKIFKEQCKFLSGFPEIM